MKTFDDFSREFAVLAKLPSKGHVYHMGYDAGLNGPNTTNCHFGLFATREMTREWERGKADGDEAKRKGAK